MAWFCGNQPWFAKAPSISAKWKTPPKFDSNVFIILKGCVIFRGWGWLPGTKSLSPKISWIDDFVHFCTTWKRRQARKFLTVPQVFFFLLSDVPCRGVPVRTVNQFCAYLRAKDPRIQVPCLQVSAETPVYTVLIHLFYSSSWNRFFVLEIRIISRCILS